MNCSNCGKFHDGYRCPYCGTFELETEEGMKRKGSLYKKQRIRVGRKQWPIYLFFILFVIGWFALVSTAVFSGKVGEKWVITDIGFSGFGNVEGFKGTPTTTDDYFTIVPKKLQVNSEEEIIAVVSVENTSSETVGFEVYAVTKMGGGKEYAAGIEDATTVLFEPGEKKKITVKVPSKELDENEVTEITAPYFRYHTYIYNDKMEAEQVEGISWFVINGKVTREITAD